MRASLINNRCDNARNKEKHVMHERIKPVRVSTRSGGVHGDVDVLGSTTVVVAVVGALVAVVHVSICR